MAASTKTKDEGTQVATLSDWKKAAVHYPLLPSGTRVNLRIPDLALLIETGVIPQHLLETALGMAKAQVTDEQKVPTVADKTQKGADDRAGTHRRPAPA